MNTRVKFTLLRVQQQLFRTRQAQADLRRLPTMAEFEAVEEERKLNLLANLDTRLRELATSEAKPPSPGRRPPGPFRVSRGGTLP